MYNINLEIPEDILFEVKSLPKGETKINDKLQLSLAVGMFVSQEISLAKAAELAKKNLGEFMDILKERELPSFFYTEDMLDDDLKFARREW
jgi:predicted HTH domain antitoxin